MLSWSAAGPVGRVVLCSATHIKRVARRAAISTCFDQAAATAVYDMTDSGSCID